MADESDTTGTLVSPEPTPGTAQPVEEQPAETAAPAAETRVVEGPWIKEDGSFVPDWHKHLPPDVQEEAAQMKLGERVKSVSELARYTINAQRLVGRKGVIIPNEKSPPEEISEYRKAMGVPEVADGYEIKPEKLPEGMDWIEDDAKPFKEIAHRNNIPPKAMKELVAAHVARQAEMGKRMEAAHVALLNKKFNEGMADLQHSWGRDFDINMQKVKQAAISTGTDLNDPGFISPGMAKMVLRLRNMVSDDKFVGAGSPNSSALNSVDPGKLAHSIMTDKNNPEYHLYHGGDKDVQNKVEALWRESERIKERSR